MICLTSSVSAQKKIFTPQGSEVIVGVLSVSEFTPAEKAAKKSIAQKHIPELFIWVKLLFLITAMRMLGV